jgi:hypothetical protein
MMLNIAADDFGGDFITHRAGEIPIFPEFPAPETPLDPWKFPKDSPSAQALKPSDYLADGIPGREGAKNMDMIWTDLHFLQGNVILLGDIGKEVPYPLLDFALQDVSSILGRPHQVVQGIVDRMRGTSENHTPL